jgi:hypothetical protein
MFIERPGRSAPFGTASVAVIYTARDTENTGDLGVSATAGVLLLSREAYARAHGVVVSARVGRRVSRMPEG